MAAIRPSPTNNTNPTSDFQRSASYTYLPEAKHSYTANSSHVLAIKGTFSEHDLIATTTDPEDHGLELSTGWVTPEEQDPKTGGAKTAAEDAALEIPQHPKISVHRLVDLRRDSSSGRADSLCMQDKTSSTSYESTSTLASAERARLRNSGSTTVSRKLQRRSWYSAATTPDSRSPSPSKNDLETAIEEEEPTTGAFDSELADHVAQSFAKQQKANSPATTAGEAQRLSSARRSSFFRRQSNRPLSSVSIAGSEHSAPARNQSKIPTSFSTDKLSSFANSRSNSIRQTGLPPRLGSTDRLSSLVTSSTLRKKDELWSVFRALDGDYAKFVAKSVTLKANVVRSTLLPFLKDYASHTSTFNLRAEDLDRRARILNKWWTALIDMLHGRNNQSLSGTDRPAILDAISGIMDRPEWRLSPSPFCPTDRRVQRLRSSRSPSMSSLGSAGTDPLMESVQNHVQNIFVQNLRSQMAFVVDKMSLRNAAASLVTFCGKACAYAFMFVPGIADVLVRLWDVQSDVLRRVLAENGIGRFGTLSQLSDDVVLLFPPCLHQLGFTTVSEFARKLRTPPPLPTGTTNIQWWGYWLQRWSGRESDLFYVFVKHFHILVTEFIPVGTTKEERMCVPGMLLVHSQILTNLDSTLHRQMGKPLAHGVVAADGSPPIVDILAEPDAVASPLPIIPVNATRVMAENRLIMLIRDFLSERAAAYPEARRLFAETFNDLLQAAARGISVYDSSASYTLLDFAEEALTILVKYEHLSTGAGTLINADFWHLVSRRLISSENTLIEVRLYAWLYTIWNTVVSDLSRKADLCLGLLLDPAVFASRFNHWSPMVRAYYMRLLCWRVARFDGDGLPGDFKILDTLLERLQTTWSHHLWLREQTSGDEPYALMSSPCNPAPHRRLRIIRTDTLVTPSSFPSFDVIIAPMISPAPPQGTNSKRLSTLSTLASVAELEARVYTAAEASAGAEESDESTSPKSIRGLLRSFVGGGRRKSHGRSSSIATPASRRESGRPALLRTGTDDFNSAQDSADSGASTPTNHRHFSFKFQMEYNINIKQPVPLRMVPPRLPAPAQQYVNKFSQRLSSPIAMESQTPTGVARKRVTYCGRALVEWALVVGECQSFFDRRRNEGVPENRFVETPALGVEILKRPS